MLGGRGGKWSQPGTARPRGGAVAPWLKPIHSIHWALAQLPGSAGTEAILTGPGHPRNGASSSFCSSLSVPSYCTHTAQGMEQRSLLVWTDTTLSGQGLCGHSRVSERLPLDRYPSLGFTVTAAQGTENLGSPPRVPRWAAWAPTVITSASLRIPRVAVPTSRSRHRDPWGEGRHSGEGLLPHRRHGHIWPVYTCVQVHNTFTQGLGCCRPSFPPTAPLPSPHTHWKSIWHCPGGPC